MAAADALRRAQALLLEARTLERQGRLRPATALAAQARMLLTQAPQPVQIRAGLLEADLLRQCGDDGAAVALLDRLAGDCRAAGDATLAAMCQLRAATAIAPLCFTEDAADRLRDRLADRAAGLLALPAGCLAGQAQHSLAHTAFHLAHHGRDDRALMALQGRVLAHLLTPPNQPAPFSSPFSTDAPATPRLGIVARHLRAHTIGHLFGPLLPELAALWPGLTLFTFDAETDGLTEATAAAVVRDGGRHVALPDALAPALALLRAARCDLLWFLDLGMDTFTVHLALARAAPLQAIGLGHPVTSGLPGMDGVVLSANLAGPATAAEFVETPILPAALPIAWTPPPAPDPATVTAVRGRLALHPGAPLLACLQSPYKLRPGFLTTAAAILTAAPEARLMLCAPAIDTWEAPLAEACAAAGLPAGRIVWLPPQPRSVFLAHVAAADVVLDPFPYGGGNTTLEALWLGRPVVTLPDRLVRGRVSRALIEALDPALSHRCVASSPANYTQKVCTWLADPAARAAFAAAVPELCAARYGANPAVESLATELRAFIAARPVSGQALK